MVGGSIFLALDGCFTSARLLKNDSLIIQNYNRHFTVEANTDEAQSDNIAQSDNTARTDNIALDIENCTSKFQAMTANESKKGKKYLNVGSSGHFGLCCARHEVFV